MEYSTRLEQKSRELEETASELQNANERLVQIDEQKDEFLTQVSHELRTPMTSIRSFSDILGQSDQIGDEKSKYFLKIINDESVRLTHLLDEILDIGSIERGNDFPLSDIDPHIALTRSIDACRGIAETENITINENFSDIKSTIYANQDRLTQVFINIISNALKYNNSNQPEITITSKVNTEHYSVIIADNGSGISEEDRSRIFEKFSRGANSSAEKGAGLGLAISRAIITKFGGELDLLPGSEPGTQFRVRLPLQSKPFTE